MFCYEVLGFDQARKKVAEALMELVKRRKEEKMKETEQETEKKKDMLDELLEAEEGFTEEEMVDFLLSLLVAGHETTPMMMTLLVKFLTDNPSAFALVKVLVLQIILTLFCAKDEIF